MKKNDILKKINVLLENEKSFYLMLLNDNNPDKEESLAFRKCIEQMRNELYDLCFEYNSYVDELEDE